MEALPLSVCPRTTHQATQVVKQQVTLTPPVRAVVCSCKQQQKAHTHCRSHNSDSIALVTRRDAIAAAVALVPLLAPRAAGAEAATADAVNKQYTDPVESFQLSVPDSWLQSEANIEGNRLYQGATGARRTIAWFPADAPADQVNVTLTVTNTSAEFTGLGSFGNVYAFGTNLVNSIDGSYLLRQRRSPQQQSEPIQIAKLVDAGIKRGMYFVEYTVEKVPGPKRYLYTLAALSFNGRYNRLYTLTAQCVEEVVQQYESTLLQILGSFVPPARSV